MRILITGSSGQIGTNLALYLQQQGHYVFGIDKRPNPWTKDFETLLQDLSPMQFNYRRGIGEVEYPPDLDAVVHFAANAKVHELVLQPHRALNNITMTFNVLEFCRSNNLPIIFSSTREVYGDIHRLVTEESHANFAFTESPYSASKISAEALIYSYAQCYGLRYLVFRFSNVYGRYDGDLERMERVIPLFIRKISRNEPVTIFGKDKTLDFTYVDDCVSGVSKGIERVVDGAIENETINLAYGQGNTLETLTHYIGDALGVTPQVSLESSRRGEVTHYVADIAKARTLLDYEPKTSLEDGIRKAVPWAMDWWSKNSNS